jgi:hypothetical protein
MTKSLSTLNDAVKDIRTMPPLLFGVCLCRMEPLGCCIEACHVNQQVELRKSDSFFQEVDDVGS